MSDNPFASSPSSGNVYVPPPGSSSVPPSAPGALTAILVICIVFAVGGLMGSCFTGVANAALPFMEKILDDARVPEAQRTFSRINIEANRAGMVPAMVVVVLNLGVATMLLIGSIGCIGKKESSRRFLRMAILVAVCFCILRWLVTAYISWAANSATKDAVEQLANDPVYEQVQLEFSSNQMILMVSFGLGILFLVAQIGFYIWSRIYLNKDHVVKYFADAEQYKRLA